jgi:hypothetical protein
VLVAASVSVIDSHIFWPHGVVTMIAVAAGMYLLSVVSPATGLTWSALQEAGSPS